MTTPTAKKPARARKVRADYIPAGFGKVSTGARWEFPADAESYDKMVEQIRRKLLSKWDAGTRHYDCVKDMAHDNARAALAAIGITRPSGDRESPDALRKRQPKRERRS